jgi:hypothetical protein
MGSEVHRAFSSLLCSEFAPSERSWGRLRSFGGDHVRTMEGGMKGLFAPRGPTAVAVVASARCG